MLSRTIGAVMVASLTILLLVCTLTPGMRAFPSPAVLSSGGGRSDSLHPVDAVAYEVNFSELGLPAGTLWQVNTLTSPEGFVLCNNTNGTSLIQDLPNGTYPFTTVAELANYSTTMTNSTFTVNGGGTTVPVHFYHVFVVSVTETGLPPYSPWNVSVRGNGTTTLGSGSASTIPVLVPVGPFNYSVQAPGFNATPPNGSGTVVSSAIHLSVGFTAALPPPGYITGVCNIGTGALYLNGLRTLVQLGGGFFFTLEPGFYSVIVTAPGYNSYYNETYVTSGATLHMYIILQGVNSTAVPNSESPGIDTLGWILIGGLAAGVVILGVVASVYSNRAGRAERALKTATLPKP